MNRRERFQCALSHREPDRVPFDLGGSIITSIAAPAYANLRAALGLPDAPVAIGNIYSQSAIIAEEVYQFLGVDTRPLDLCDPVSQEIEFVDEGGYRYYCDEWGMRYGMPLNGTSGYALVSNPLEKADGLRQIEEYACPDAADPRRYTSLEGKAHRLANIDQVGVILETNIGGIFEWPAWLRGMENFMSDLAGDPAMAEALIEKVTDYKVAFWTAVLSLAGNNVDLIRESDDLGGQAGLLISPKMYRKYIKPGHKRICEAIRKHTVAAICIHSCGAVWDLIPDFIEAGFTVLNPVQIGTAKMDPVALKREFGRDMVFWGGSCDSQKTLPYASPEEVRSQARRNMEAFAPGGGYIFAPINMINADVPPENIIALAEVVRDFGVYQD